MGLSAKSLEGYEPKGVGGPSEWFRPKPGDGGKTARYDVRLVMEPGEDQPFFDAKIHYFRYGGSFYSGACPRHFGEECKACDMFFRLRLLPEWESEAGKEVIRKLAPQTRVYANVLNRGQDRIQVWSMTFKVYEDLKNNLLTYLESGIDLTDPYTGRDMVVPVSKKGAVQNYGAISVRPEDSPLDLEGWEAQIHDLRAKALQRTFTDEELDNHIEGVLGGHLELAMEQYLMAKDFDKAANPTSAAGSSSDSTKTKDGTTSEEIGEEL